MALAYLSAQKRYTKKKALLLILASLCCGFVPAAGGVYFYRWQSCRPAHKLTALVCSAQGVYTLPALCFAELLQLSGQAPCPLHMFCVDEGRTLLEKTGLFSHIALKKMPPDTLYIAYTLRTPWVEVADMSNTYMDREGVFFPALPFYTPKVLPKVFLGEQAQTSVWGETLGAATLDTVRAVVGALMQPAGPCVFTVDVRHLSVGHKGMRGIVVQLPGREGSCDVIRLDPKRCLEGLQRYQVLRQEMLEEHRGYIVDVRLTQLAYVRKIE